MKKKITAVLMAAVMAVAMVACGPAENPDAIIYEYTPYQYSREYMPVEITTDQEIYDAWEYVIDKAMGDGATFGGVPALSMSKGYFRQQTSDMGYDHRELTNTRLTAEGEDYIINVTTGLSRYESDPVKNISVQIFQMYEDDFNQETLNEVNDLLSIGQSQQLLGKDIYETLDYLEISDLMLEFIREFGRLSAEGTGANQGTRYTYSWYEGDNAKYDIAYYEGYNSSSQRETMVIGLSREENGYYQNVTYSNVSGGPICSVDYKEEDNSSEKYMQSFTKGALRWHTKEHMVGLWAITEKIENDAATAVDFDDAYLSLDWGGRGRMVVPVFSDRYVEINWSNSYESLQENPEEKLVFEVSVDNKQMPSVFMEYYYADDSIIMKNQEKTLAYKFERVY